MSVLSQLPTSVLSQLPAKLLNQLPANELNELNELRNEMRNNWLESAGIELEDDD